MVFCGRLPALLAMQFISDCNNRNFNKRSKQERNHSFEVGGSRPVPPLPPSRPLPSLLPSISLPFPPLPLEVGPLNPARGSGGAL